MRTPFLFQHVSVGGVWQEKILTTEHGPFFGKSNRAVASSNMSRVCRFCIYFFKYIYDSTIVMRVCPFTDSTFTTMSKNFMATTYISANLPF